MWCYDIELIEGSPPHNNQSNYEFSLFDKKIIDLELSKLFAKRVIVPSCHEEGEFISPIFVCPRKRPQSSHDFKLKAS